MSTATPNGLAAAAREAMLVTASVLETLWLSVATTRADALLAGVVGALVSGTIGWALLRRYTRRGGVRSQRARTLATRGMDRAEIARQTGLSRDALAMLLAAETTRGGRRKVPGTARIAAENPDPSSARRAVATPQVDAGNGVMGSVPRRRTAAHRLLDTLLQTVRTPRHGRAA